MSRATSQVALAAAGFALAELVAGLTIGAFFARDRAEVAIFLAFRPWLLLLLAACLSHWPAGRRWAAYAAALLLASASEALLAALCGGGGIVADAARAWVAGLALMLPIDLAFVLARRVEPRFARLLGLTIGLGLLLVPGQIAPPCLFERIALRAEPPPVAGPRPVVALLSGLPLLWAPDAPPDTRAYRPNAALRRLGGEFAIRPIDTATPSTLAGARVLLAAQPRLLSAEEIETIDRWVRMGGRALLLVDADLRWPSALPPGDPRRPPALATLAPLLAGWGVTVSRRQAGIAPIDLPVPQGRRRIVTDAPGLLRAEGDCRPLAGGHAASCRIGRGQALVLADADMLDDRLWVGDGTAGDSRLRRGGDNALLLAEWLDLLAANPRDRLADSVDWMRRGVRLWVFMVALLPALLIGLFAARDLRLIAWARSIRAHIVIHRNKRGSVAELRGQGEKPPPT